MEPSDQSLSARQLQGFSVHHRLKSIDKAKSCRFAMASIVGLGFVLSACDKPSEAPKVIAPSEVVDRAPPASPASSNNPVSPLTTPVTADTEALADEAWSIMNRYPDMNAQELLNVPEVNSKLATALKRLSEDTSLQADINSTVDLAAKFKGLDGPPGSYKLNLDVSVYNDSRPQRMLQAVLSEEPRQVVKFLIEELGEASFEFTFTGVDKTSNGIAIDPVPGATPTPPPFQTDPDDLD